MLTAAIDTYVGPGLPALSQGQEPSHSVPTKAIPDPAGIFLAGCVIIGK